MQRWAKSKEGGGLYVLFSKMCKIFVINQKLGTWIEDVCRIFTKDDLYAGCIELYLKPCCYSDLIKWSVVNTGI